MLLPILRYTHGPLKVANKEVRRLEGEVASGIVKGSVGEEKHKEAKLCIKAVYLG